MRDHYTTDTILRTVLGQPANQYPDQESNPELLVRTEA